MPVLIESGSPRRVCVCLSARRCTSKSTPLLSERLALLPATLYLSSLHVWAVGASLEPKIFKNVQDPCPHTCSSFLHRPHLCADSLGQFGRRVGHFPLASFVFSYYVCSMYRIGHG